MTREPGAANQVSNSSVHARKMASDGARIMRSTVKEWVPSSFALSSDNRRAPCVRDAIDASPRRSGFDASRRPPGFVAAKPLGSNDIKHLESGPDHHWRRRPIDRERGWEKALFNLVRMNP